MLGWRFCGCVFLSFHRWSCGLRARSRNLRWCHSYIHIHTYIHTSTLYICMHAYIQTLTYIQTHADCIHIQSITVCIHTYLYILYTVYQLYMCMYVCMCVYVCMKKIYSQYMYRRVVPFCGRVADIHRRRAPEQERELRIPRNQQPAATYRHSQRHTFTRYSIQCCQSRWNSIEKKKKTQIRAYLLKLFLRIRSIHTHTHTYTHDMLFLTLNFENFLSLRRSQTEWRTRISYLTWSTLLYMTRRKPGWGRPTPPVRWLSSPPLCVYCRGLLGWILDDYFVQQSISCTTEYFGAQEVVIFFWIIYLIIWKETACFARSLARRYKK